MLNLCYSLCNYMDWNTALVSLYFADPCYSLCNYMDWNSLILIFNQLQHSYSLCNYMDWNQGFRLVGGVTKCYISYEMYGLKQNTYGCLKGIVISRMRCMDWNRVGENEWWRIMVMSHMRHMDWNPTVYFFGNKKPRYTSYEVYGLKNEVKK